jgi:MFS family permease
MRILLRMELKHKQRYFLSVFFFLAGFCFSTWASRIPTIKVSFNFNDAELGTILLCMPISSLAGLPISGWLVSRYNSRVPLMASLVVLVLALSFIGSAKSVFALSVGMCLFAFHMRILGIAMNAQGLALQRQFERRIYSSFHGLWSTGGITGVGFSTLVIALGVKMSTHMYIVSGLCLLVGAFSYRFLLPNDRSTTGNKFIIGKPDPHIIILGLLVFFASICEGGMFDWSGIYFKEIVKVQLFTLGYLIFMISMALSRFATDRVVEMIGMPKTFIVSALFIFLGISTAILLPTFWPGMIGFCLVGLGTASVIPMTFMLASTVEKYSPAMTISIIATYGIAGIFIGPPLIGYLAHAFNLRVSFTWFAFSGIMLIPISRMFFRRQAAKNG